MQTELDASIATRVSRELGGDRRALERLYRHPEQFGICEDTGEEYRSSGWTPYPPARSPHSLKNR
jgi:hypothetical protein